jgi:bifunctional N-acetylglucosamine-1-phosphate-uridyltransferase/glucosamine-1-phosphate-acetyltransferase GlmU-like protein
MVVVVGYEADMVREALSNEPGVTFVEQVEQRGTGHAVMMCREQLLAHDGPVIILAGDSPLVQSDSLSTLLEPFSTDNSPACLLGTLHKDDPTGLGRIVRDEEGAFAGIVEEKDASDAQCQITEVNMSTYVFSSPDLLKTLDHLTDNNQQGEYYLTDCPGILQQAGQSVAALPVLKPCEALSVNSQQDLAKVQQEMESQGY